ncbi:hypothetical protein TNCV_1500861 [Trichonephila clavipes]|uniref:Uncharacterized protein n=1 Tax=Trichonephila clavipes TaxID=2585209 RepID=A0A8X6V8M7_TRICX|nr:hypothetical protein TNCV_1500861 [Trichonephila clavipes]
MGRASDTRPEAGLGPMPPNTLRVHTEYVLVKSVGSKVLCAVAAETTSAGNWRIFPSHPAPCLNCGGGDRWCRHPSSNTSHNSRSGLFRYHGFCLDSKDEKCIGILVQDDADTTHTYSTTLFPSILGHQDSSVVSSNTQTTFSGSDSTAGPLLLLSWLA